MDLPGAGGDGEMQGHRTMIPFAVIVVFFIFMALLVRFG